MTTHNYQQLNLKKQNQKQPKQTTGTGTDPQKWRSYGGLSVGLGKGIMGEKVQGIRSINGRYRMMVGGYKADGNKGEKQMNNCNSIINLYIYIYIYIYMKKQDP